MQLAKNLEGEQIHISGADRVTNYFCLICNSPVVVKKGKKKEHHYAHLQHTGDDCELKYKDLYENHSSLNLETEVINNEVDYNIEFDVKKETAIEEVVVEKTLPEIIQEIKSKYSLTSCQDKAIDEFFKWYENNGNKRYYTISGVSGSGKTFLLKVISEVFDEIDMSYNTISFTGKAVNVLRERGLKNTSTLHSLMYKPILDDEDKIIGWNRNYTIECEFLFVDEFSMLSQQMIDDLLMYNVPMLFSGDDRQICPVSATDNNLISSVDFHLSTVIRQQAGNPIIKHANEIREGNLPSTNFRDKNEFGSFSVVGKEKVTVEKLEKVILNYDMILVGTNKKRVMINNMIRRLKDYKKILNKNEILIILKNDGEYYNGQQLIVNEILKIHTNGLIYVKTNEGNLYISDYFLEKQEANINEIYRKKYFLGNQEIKPLFVTYGYCMTSFKAQGSTCNKCLVFGNDMLFAYYRAEDKKIGWDNYIRLIYTSVTRSSEEVILIL